MRRHDHDRLRTELLDAHRRIGELLRLLPDLWPELIDGLPGYPTSTAGGGSAPRLAADGTPAGLDRYLIGPNPAAEDMRTLQQSAFAASTAARTSLDIAHRWLATAVTTDDGPRNQSPASGDCHACGVYCSGGTDSDRLRAGLCDACRHSWARYQQRTRGERGGGDRAEWLLERRRDIAAAGA